MCFLILILIVQLKLEKIDGKFIRIGSKEAKTFINTGTGLFEGVDILSACTLRFSCSCD